MRIAPVDVPVKTPNRRRVEECSAQRSPWSILNALRHIVCLLGLFGLAATAAGATPAIANDRAPLIQSETDYAVRENHQMIATIRVYIYDRGLYVWPENLLPLLGISVEPNAQAGTIKLRLNDSTTILLDRNNSNYIKNDKTYDLDVDEVILQDDHIAVSLDFLNRLLPKAIFLANRADKVVAVSVSDCAQPDQWCRIPARATPGAPSHQSFTVDSASGPSTATSADHEASATAGIHKQETVESERIDTLILQPKIKNLPPKDDYLEVLDRGGTLFLPLNDVVQLFGFPIKIDKAKGTISGYMFEPDMRFLLDVTAKHLSVGERQFSLTMQDILVHDGGVYVSSEAFATWFEIETKVDRKQQSVHFLTSHRLPDEDREERRKRWQKLVDRSNDKIGDFLVLENPYRPIAYPVFDVSLNALYNPQAPSVTASTPAASANYNIQGVGDVAYATGHLYMAGGTNGRLVDTLRVTVGRKDPDAKLLAGLHATEFAVGDIASPSLTLVTTNSIGRGLMLTNRAVDATENFDVRNFSGDAVPGYQAELYRNSDLIGFQTVGPDGRYNFNNVQILYGENIFRIVLYGPQGQKEERIQTIETSASLLKPGELQYSFGIDQRGASLIPVTQNRKNASLPVGMQAVANLRYGVFPYLTTGVFAAATALRDGEHYYYGGSLAGSLSRLQTETTYIRDIENGGWAASISAMTNLYGLNLRTFYRKYSAFISESVNANDTPLSSDAGIDTNAQALLPLIGVFSYGLSASHQTFENRQLHSINSYTLRFAKSVAGVGFSNMVYFADYPTRTLQDTFSFQTRFATVDVRLSGIYQLQPFQELQQVNLAANYQVIDSLAAQTELEKQTAASGNYGFTQTFYWDFEAFRLGLYGHVDTDKTYSTGISLTFSLARNPITEQWHSQPKPFSDSGIVAGHVYIKSDGDWAGAPSDLQKASIKIDNHTVSVDQNANYLSSATAAYRKVKVEIDPSSVADPLLSPEHKGYLIMTHPGSPALVDFPLVMTTTIEGTAFILDKEGKKLPLKETVVELEDKNGKPLRRIITEFDGYFSFDRVGVGAYRLGVPSEVLSEYKATIKVQPHIDISKITEFISNRDIVLAPAE